MSVLVLGEVVAGKLSPSLRSAVTAANQLSGEVHVLIAGLSVDEAVGEAATILGITKILQADHPVFAHALPENIASLVASLEGYSHILAVASSYGKDILPRISALLNVQQISEVSRIISSDTYQHFIYAGNILETVKCIDPVLLLTVRATAFEPAALGGKAIVEKLDETPANILSEWLNDETTKTARPELASSRIVVSGGRGLGSKENFRLLEEIADKLGAALGASRAAVDAGYVPNDYQVGQTGKVVAPELYIAVGISGAIQHLAGMKDSKVIVAINKDENAPIFEIADYGLVGDLFEVLPKLAALL